MPPNSSSTAPPHEVLTATEVAGMLRLTPAHVRRLAADGKLPARRIGGSWRFPRTAIVELLAADPALLEAAEASA